MDHSMLHIGHDVHSASQEVINTVHAYMRIHPESELHRCGKMFGILLVKTSTDELYYLSALSAMLDGTYTHDGFVPPVYDMPTPPVGTNKADSKRLQRLLFAQYNLLNGRGEARNLLDIFANEKPIVTPEEWFSNTPHKKGTATEASLPPSGAGECCAPKLLQFALSNGLKPIALAEFWVGASPQNELRREGCFYAPCSGRCVPILRHMLQGIEGLTIEGLTNNRQIFRVEDIPILFEDDYLVVANKPAGLLTVPGKSDEPSLATLLSEQRGYPILPAHRLDQDTSGLVVLAKTADTYKTLQAYFQRRDILKRYEAVCRGENIPKEGTIELPLLPNPFDRPRQMVDFEHGKPSITYYKIRERRSNGTVLIDMFPRTGRTHQLRVHAAHPQGLNAPIIGDRLYGEAASRLKLHAAEIRFTHPITKEEMHFCIPSNF